MKRLLSLFLAFLLASAPAFASSFAEMTIKPSTKATYMGSTAFTTPPAATTDMFQLFGNASNKVKVLWISACYQGAGISTAADQIFLVKRSTANSAGTAGTTTVTPLDSTNAASSSRSTCKVYTANPTTGTLLGQLSTSHMCAYVPPGGAATVSYIPPMSVLFDARLTGQPITLNSASEGVCVNFNGVIPSASTPKLAFNIIWTEE